MNDIRKNCKYRHDNGNCLKIGGFCLAVDDEYCIKTRENIENCESEAKVGGQNG